VRPQTDASGLAKPLTMLLFGMLNWMFTWLRPDGALSYRQMTEIVSDLFFNGLTGLPIAKPAARGAPRRRPAA
jgi:TetR/AcrR family transcriptional regulator